MGFIKIRAPSRNECTPNICFIITAFPHCFEIIAALWPKHPGECLCLPLRCAVCCAAHSHFQAFSLVSTRDSTEGFGAQHCFNLCFFKLDVNKSISILFFFPADDDCKQLKIYLRIWMQGKRMCVSKFLIYFVLSYCVQSEIREGMLTAGPQSGLFCFMSAKRI